MADWGRRETTGHGFTLVELLVVISILVILMSVFVNLVVGTNDTAKEKKTQVFLGLLRESIKGFEDRFKQGYPPDRWYDDAAQTPRSIDLDEQPPEITEPDRSSRFLLFWLAFDLMGARSDEMGRAPKIKRYKQLLTDLKPDQIRPNSDQVSGEAGDRRDVERFIKKFNDPEVWINLVVTDIDTSRQEEAKIQKFDPNAAKTDSALSSREIMELVEKVILVDGWGHPIRYRIGYDDEGRVTGFEIVSAGRDEKWNSGDEIRERFSKPGAGSLP